MACDAKIRMRDEFLDLKPYDPGFCAQEVVVSANENPFGMPDDVRAAALDAVAKVAFERYPNPLADALRDDIAAWHGLDRSRVFVGNGGDELLFDLLLAFGGPDRVLIDCPPTFGIYALYAKLTGTRVRSIARDAADFSLDEKAIEQAASQADIVMLASPNNPTGNTLDPAWIAALSRRVRGFVVVDEAYGEFADDATSCIGLLESCDNVAVLRTFSKAFASAGLRCGYLLAPPALVEGIAAVRQPYSVDVVSQAIARVVVGMRASFAPSVSAIKSERARMAEGLARIDGVSVWPSEGNFLLVRMAHAHAVYERLRDEYSILARDFSWAPLLKDCLRITVGTPGENDRVLAAMSSIAKEGMS